MNWSTWINSYEEILKKSKFNKNDIDEVIMGQVLTAGAGQNQQDKQQ